MHVFRVSRAAYPDLDGKGAAIGGARWNSPGTRIVYASSCGALAALEYLVHAKETPDDIPEDLLLRTIDVPDTLRIEHAKWMPDIRTSRRFGDLWVKNKRSPVLAVPSVIVPRQINYLLNPTHTDMGTVTVVHDEPFVLDVRLFDTYPIV